MRERRKQRDYVIIEKEGQNPFPPDFFEALMQFQYGRESDEGFDHLLQYVEDRDNEPV